MYVDEDVRSSCGMRAGLAGLSLDSGCHLDAWHSEAGGGPRRGLGHEFDRWCAAVKNRGLQTSISKR